MVFFSLEFLYFMQHGFIDFWGNIFLLLYKKHPFLVLPNIGISFIFQNQIMFYILTLINLRTSAL